MYSQKWQWDSLNFLMTRLPSAPKSAYPLFHQPFQTYTTCGNSLSSIYMPSTTSKYSIYTWCLYIASNSIVCKCTKKAKPKLLASSKFKSLKVFDHQEIDHGENCLGKHPWGHAAWLHQSPRCGVHCNLPFCLCWSRDSHGRRYS